VSIADGAAAGPRRAGVARSGLRDLWTARRARLWLIAAVVTVYVPIIGVPFRGWFDFAAFYTAGKLAFSDALIRLGDVPLYQLQNGLPITPWVYPASLALVYVPLAQLPYAAAGALHFLIMTAFLVVAAWIGAAVYELPRRWAVLGALAWAPAAASALSGQNATMALLLTVLVAAGLKSIEQRRALGIRAGVRSRLVGVGAAVGVLLYKPQLAAPLVGTLGWRSAWISLLAIVAALGVHYGLGVIATGGNTAWPIDWMTPLSQYNEEDVRINGWQYVSAPGFLGRLGLLVDRPLLGYVGYAFAGLVVLASLPALRRWSGPAAIALASAVGLVASPHALTYDATLLLPALALFARAAMDRGWPARDRWLLFGAYVLAVSWPVGGAIGFVPLVFAVILAPAILLGWGPFRSASVTKTATGSRTVVTAPA
jgi:hypothetical protein